MLRRVDSIATWRPASWGMVPATMAELRTQPFSALVTLMFRELRERDSIFGLPRKKFFLGSPDHDLSVRFHGRRCPTALGPAAGPHTQMAHNIVLSWLAGCRIMELKTVQILDQLEIPRPCIDARTVGYNIEWSQELRLHEALREYVSASMLIEMLVASGETGISADFAPPIFDMSVGYDLKGIRSPAVRGFIAGMRDATDTVDGLRAQIPAEFSDLRDLDFTTALSDTLTLSTFHGCPPEEIEQITHHLLTEQGLNAIVKLNPTLLGQTRLQELLDGMGYTERVPEAAFLEDATWTQAVGFLGRLGETAKAEGRGFGVKFTNTLIVENDGEFLPGSEARMYLSGQPLHVLAMNLVGRLRDTVGDAYPISFSAGIDQHNFADAVSLGLVPVTVCTDLLRTGGYGRARAYFKRLISRMDAVGAADIDHFVLLARGNAEAALDGLPESAAATCREALTTPGSDLRTAATEHFEAWLSAARLLNTRDYVAQVTDDPRYGRAKNNKPPKKTGTYLTLFDCLTCDKCVPVCPNNANFVFTPAQTTVPAATVRPTAAGLVVDEKEAIELEQRHQLATFMDFCNECGNCDVFCPESGGPYVLKPRFFGTQADFELFSDHDGFWVGPDRTLARVEGNVIWLAEEAGKAHFVGEDFDLSLAPDGQISGHAASDVDLTWLHILRLVRQTVLGEVNAVSARMSVP